jgi:large subunit ribosomal protein L29
MKVKEIRELNNEEINSKIDDTRKSIVDLRFQLAMRKLESPAKLRTARKLLAQLLTIQNEKLDAEIKKN